MPKSNTNNAEVVESISKPNFSERRELLATPATVENEQIIYNKTASLYEIEYRRCTSPQQLGRARPNLAAWNIQQGHEPESVVDKLLKAQIDIALLSECDIGVERTQYIHVVEQIATKMSADYAFATEFIELEHGLDESKPQPAGLHGNAIISRYPIEDLQLIRLVREADWFIAPRTKLRRVGSRCGLIARLRLPFGSLVVAVTHFESDCGPQGRQRQAEQFFSAVSRYAGDCPVVIGGDFNAGARVDAFDFRQEGLFEVARTYGFSWGEANACGTTTRNCQYGGVFRPGAHLDWFFIRNLKVHSAAIIAAINECGSAISDHELITLTVSYGE